MSSLIDAATAGDLKLIKSLLDAGEDINQTNDYGRTALHWAARNNQLAAVRLLIERGADLHPIDCDKCTALDWATRGGHANVAALLKEAGAMEKPQTDPAAARISWAVIAPQQVAQIRIYPTIGQKLTTIFNFETRQSLVIVDDLRTQAKAVTPLADFDDMKQPQQLEQALEEFTKQGGKADRDFVLRGVKRLEK